LVKRDDWGYCEIEAWRLLSGVLVLNTPQLPVEARSWLNGQLKDLITHNELSADGWAFSPSDCSEVLSIIREGSAKKHVFFAGESIRCMGRS
jgi:hypothetical protein